jgi:hypothetical protein
MEEALRAILAADATLSGLVGTRIYWDTIPQGKPSPNIAMWLVSSVPDYHMAGASGLVESRVQVDCRGDSWASAKAVARAVEAVLGGFVGQQGTVVFKAIFKISDRSSFETPTDGSEFLSSADYQVFTGLAA